MLQHLLSGLATGAIYALLALAVVLIYQTTRHINLAQGEMAMFTTFIAWQMMVVWNVPYWLAFIATIATAIVLGIVVQRVLIYPMREAPPRFQIGAMIAVFLILNSLAGFLWNQDIKALPSPFGTEPLFGSPLISAHRAGMIGVTLVTIAGLYLMLFRTRFGLRLRAASENRTSARMVGISVDRVMMLGWGIAAALGAIAGMMIAPIVFVEPQMMFLVFPYAIAAAVLGGLGNPFGAAVGGFVLGIIETFSAVYLPTVGRELKLVISLAIIVAVLVLRPQGLFGGRVAERA